MSIFSLSLLNHWNDSFSYLQNISCPLRYCWIPLYWSIPISRYYWLDVVTESSFLDWCSIRHRGFKSERLFFSYDYINIWASILSQYPMITNDEKTMKRSWKFGKIQMLQKVRDKVLDIKRVKFQLNWNWYSDRH